MSSPISGTRSTAAIPCACTLAMGYSRSAGSPSFFARINPSAAFRGLLAGGGIESDGGADQRRERVGVDFLALMNVDGAPHIAVEARIEELGGIFEGGALKEGQLHDRLVRFAGADAAVVGPYRCAAPLPFFHNSGIRLHDEGADPFEGIASPVIQLRDSIADEL